jgi:deoxycytidine triphosphate deaminase
LESGESFISPFSEEAVTAIAYDLGTESFAVEPGNEKTSYDLLPGESVFVKSKETIKFPNDIIGRVILRNSWIRQGLMLSAPVYYPGHHTRIFYRITNISKQSLKLDCEKGIASIMFEKLDGPVLKPYEGTFQGEFDFSGYVTKYDILCSDGKIIAKNAFNECNNKAK